MADIKGVANIISKIPKVMQDYEQSIGIVRNGVSYMSEAKRIKARKNRKKRK